MSVKNWKESLELCLVGHSRDWAGDGRDAWLWGIIQGWDDEDGGGIGAMGEIAEKFCWDKETVARLRTLRQQFINANVRDHPREIGEN